jgi:hypothetical protein
LDWFDCRFFLRFTRRARVSSTSDDETHPARGGFVALETATTTTTTTTRSHERFSIKSIDRRKGEGFRVKSARARLFMKTELFAEAGRGHDRAV